MTLESVTVCKAAQRNYALFSGVLILWETLGLELDRALPSLINIHVENETAAQYVVLAVLIYCGFRFTVERLYITPLRKFSRLERFDFFATHSLAVVALSIWTVNHAGTSPEVFVVVVALAWCLTICLFTFLHMCFRVMMWVKLRRELPMSWHSSLAAAMLERIEYSLFTFSMHLYIIFMMREPIYKLDIPLMHVDAYISFCIVAILAAGFISLSYQAPERPWETPIGRAPTCQQEPKLDVTQQATSGSLLVLIARLAKAALARRHP